MNQLEKIFDKEKVQERQELANEFAKLGAEKIGDIAREKGWGKNDPRRVILHGLLGGITAKLGGNHVLSGTMAGASVESLQPVLDKFMKDHPDMREEATAILGYATGKLFGGDGDSGAAAAWSSTKFNWLSHEQMEAYKRTKSNATTKEKKAEIDAEYMELDKKQNEYWLENQKSGIYLNVFRNYGEEPWIFLLSKEDVKNTGITFAKDALTGGLDYRASQVTGKIMPMGTVINTISTISNEIDINKYGYTGVNRRVLLTILASGSSLYLFRDKGIFTGIVYASLLDISLDKFKDNVAPELSSIDLDEKRKDEDKDYLINGMD